MDEPCKHLHVERVAVKDRPATRAECVECGLWFVPVMAVRDVVADAAALAAGTGHPGDALISGAMFQALDVIDKAFADA